MKFNIFLSAFLVAIISKYVNCQPIPGEEVIIVKEEPIDLPLANVEQAHEPEVKLVKLHENSEQVPLKVKLHDDFDQAPVLLKRSHHKHGKGRFRKMFGGFKHRKGWGKGWRRHRKHW